MGCILGHSNSVLQIASRFAEEHDTAVIFYSGTIDLDGFGRLLGELQPSDERPKRDNVLLILTTYGGDANAAYQIARALQRSFDRFQLYVPAFCKSAGTLVALGSNELIMDGIAELGPLDAQLYQRDEIGQIRSGLLLRTAFEGLRHETLGLFEELMLQIKFRSEGSVTFDSASKIASQIAAGVMVPIYAQVSPEALGNDLRDLNVAKEYGKRLVRYGKNATSEAVDALVHNYPSHNFIIDCEEANTLFSNVEFASADLVDLRISIGPSVYGANASTVVKRLDQKSGEEQNDAQSGDGEPDAATGMDEGCGSEGTGDKGDC